jgi:hypothetical protein
MPTSCKIDEALSKVGVVGSQGRFDFPMRDGGIEFVFQCMVGNARGIVEGVKRVRCARNHVDRSRREQGNSYQGGSDPRNARYALLRWFQFLVPLS